MKYGTELVDDYHPVSCLWCGLTLTDGRIGSGFTGKGPDWCANGDYGCDASPDSGEDGFASHTPNILATWDGHLVRVSTATYVTADVDHRHDAAGNLPVPYGFAPHGTQGQPYAEQPHDPDWTVEKAIQSAEYVRDYLRCDHLGCSNERYSFA